MDDAAIPNAPIPRHSSEQDGRRKRSATSRRRIVEAMLFLVQQGDVTPSADRVAAAAGVGRRTVFRLFRDMDSIYAEMQTVLREAVAPVRALPLTGNTATERLHALIDRRALFFETVLPAMVAAAVHRPRSAVLQADYAAMQAELRSIMWPLLPPGHEADPQLGEALDALLSIDLWKRLRIDQAHSPEQATALLHRLLDAVLGSVGPG